MNNVYDPENNNLDKFKINYITNVYNEIVDNKHSNIQDLVDPKDIIFLFNRYDGKRISGSNLKYRRFLGQDDNDNPSLFDNTSIELYNNKVDLEWAIENKLSLEPGMIIVLKDTDGNILNPGFDVSSESELEWIKSDSVFGTESIIRDNYIRTKIIRPLQNQVYYQESEDAEYSEDNFISNKIERVFSFSVPDKNLDSNNSSSTGATITYYYLSYEDCYNNFLSYLRTLCTPVTIKS